MRNEICSLIDADSIVFMVAFNLKEESDIDVCHRLTDTFVESILFKTNCTHYLGFLGGVGNFRRDLYPDYKVNRGDKPDWFLKWEKYIVQRLVDKWFFVVSNGIEAEDALVIASEYYKDKTNLVYCHIDKDLNFLEGNHMNYATHKFWYSDKIGGILEGSKLKGYGLKFYYAQLVCGDAVDSIKGLPRKGVAFARKLLENKNTQLSMARAVYKTYLEYSTREEYIKTRTLVRMLHKEAYDFVVPNLVPRRIEDTNIEEYIL